MDFNLKVGQTCTVKKLVTKEDTAKSVASGGLEVFGSPKMFSMMEEACFKCVDEQLGDLTTVGIKLSSTHMAPTPVGMEVRVTATLVEIDRKRLVFDVVAEDEMEVIGKGRHERFIIDASKFLSRVEEKINK